MALNLSDMSRADLEALAAKAIASSNRKLTLKVSDKGAISVYGMGRFPVTLYGGQWDRLLDCADEIRAFMELNRDKLATKP